MVPAGLVRDPTRLFGVPPKPVREEADIVLSGVALCSLPAVSQNAAMWQHSATRLRDQMREYRRANDVTHESMNCQLVLAAVTSCWSSSAANRSRFEHGDDFPKLITLLHCADRSLPYAGGIDVLQTISGYGAILELDMARSALDHSGSDGAQLLCQYS